MHVSTLVRRSIALLAVVATASACSDATTAPQGAGRPAFDVQAAQAQASRSDAHDNSRYSDGDENVATLTIDPNVARTYWFGENWISFPAHSICDPATSGYGPTLWDTPCTPLTRPITVTVRWSSRGGFAYAQFLPELRFVPAAANDKSHWVLLSLHSHKRIRVLDNYRILYNGSGSTGWVDEALADPTLCAWLDPRTNSVVRRVKHFSGYMVAAGFFDGMGLGGTGDASY